jgi:uncharacterized protein HemX
MKKLITAAVFAALGLGAVAQAAPVVNARQLNQERRIDAGKRSGKLTRAEATRLKAEQRAIAMEEKRMRARHGGKLTASDKRILHARQEAANRHILNQKQDGQRGPNKLKL